MTHSRARRLGALVLTAAALALVAPSVASAATTANLEADGTITLTGDAGGDRLTLASNAANGDRAKFDRTNRGNFTIDSGANERFQINGFAGDDDITLGDGLAAQPGAVLVSVDGGSGIDTIRGGDGPDLIRGGDGNDNLAGGGADDEIIGDRGDDRMSGGGGDDKLIWNNGDGSDDMIGDDGYDVTEVNGFTAAETFVVKPQNGVARLDRTLINGTAVGLFGLNMATEALQLNTFGGDDDLTIQDAISARVDGGAGNDTLRGADGDDSLFGGSGNDSDLGALLAQADDQDHLRERP